MFVQLVGVMATAFLLGNMAVLVADTEASTAE